MSESLAKVSDQEDRDRVYSARELVDMTLAGHFCIRESIDRGIRQVYRLRGAKGREHMDRLPGLKAFASEAEIDEWERELQRLVDDVSAEVRKDRTSSDLSNVPALFEKS
jgi:hypothetical protein